MIKITAESKGNQTELAIKIEGQRRNNRHGGGSHYAAAPETDPGNE